MAAICEEFENHQAGSGEPEILMRWQQYMERIEPLSPESKVSRFCMEAGFMRDDTGDF